MGFGGGGLVDAHQHVVVQGDVAELFDTDRAKEPAIWAKHVIASGLDAGAVPQLGPCAEGAMSALLGEMQEEVLQSKGSKDVGDAVSPRRC